MMINDAFDKSQKDMKIYFPVLNKFIPTLSDGFSTQKEYGKK